jgi:hypothetical protein
VQDGVITDGEYTDTASFDGGNYTLYWKTDADTIYVGMKAKINGFVALGVSPGTGMANADIVFGYSDNGKAVVMDMFSTGMFGPHPEDTSLGGKNDLLAVGAKESGGYTVVEFKRKMDTGDKYDRPFIKGANKIIWSYGPSHNPPTVHAVRGAATITIK